MKRELAAGLVGLTLGAGGVTALPNDFSSLDEIASAQNAHMQRTGSYFLSTDNKSPRSELGKHLPEGYQLYTYVSPRGEKGWWIEYSDAETFYSVGYGVLADERTYAKKLPLIIASSTP
jgi:hypothetical protein